MCEQRLAHMGTSGKLVQDPSGASDQQSQRLPRPALVGLYRNPSWVTVVTPTAVWMVPRHGGPMERFPSSKRVQIYLQRSGALAPF